MGSPFDDQVPHSIPHPLQATLGNEASLALADYVNGSLQLHLERAFDRFEARSRAHLHEELLRVRQELREELRQDLRQELREELRQDLRKDFREELHDLRLELR